MFLFEEKHVDINDLISNALEESELFLHHQEQFVMETNLSQQLLYSVDKRWCRPAAGMVKCNMSVSWFNSKSMCGRVWITRDHTREVVMHVRDAFSPVTSRLIADLRGLLWVVRSLRDLRIDNCEI